MKQAACLVCRRSKIKCLWAPNEGRCKRCVQLDCECVRPDFHAGRQKGIKNKRVGLEKALYQIEQAVTRRRAGRSQGDEDERVVRRLQELFSQGGGSSHGDDYGSQISSSRNQDDDGDDMSSDGDDDDDVGMDPSPMSDFVQRAEESLAIDDAENPLQLLARASYFQPPSRPQHKSSPQRIRHDGSVHGRESTESSALGEFFAPPRSHLDVGDDVDPITLGLVTEEEADSLFSFFHARLAHTRWGLDPRIYTFSFTRTRSAFLLTSIMGASALFMASASALSKRLFNHVKALANQVMLRGYRSVEIVLAFMVNIPWMFPGRHSTDDDTCRYVSMATTMAIDLSLHKVLLSTSMLGSESRKALSRGECIDPKAALAIDGYPDLEPSSERGALLLRSRERCWISLFVVERGISLARGRPFIVPMSRSLKDCDNWHRSPFAEHQDSHVVSMAVLRRDLDGLFNTVRALCDGSQTVSTDGSLIAQSIQGAIERFFDQWYTEWGASIQTGPQGRLPPYVEILVTHTRLSIYGGVINHPTAPLEVRQFFRTAGLSSALNVMRTAIQGEAQLQSMPNNTAIMITFAACFALTLSAYATDGSTLAPSVKKLIDETAGVLERIGSVTEHRNGLSTLYGRYLRQIVRRAASSGAPTRSNPPAMPFSTPPNPIDPSSARAMPMSTPMHRASQASIMDQQPLWPEAVQFSTMSNDQIVEVLNQPGNEFEMSFGGLSWEDMNNFDWLHWPELGGWEHS